MSNLFNYSWRELNANQDESLSSAVDSDKGQSRCAEEHSKSLALAFVVAEEDLVPSPRRSSKARRVLGECRWKFRNCSRFSRRRRKMRKLVFLRAIRS